MRITATAPPSNPCSQAFVAPKGNGELGVKGLPVLRCVDCFGMAFFDALRRAAQRPAPEPWARGA
eukprot:6235355-Pyramimonas_sp.AAC.1